MKCLVTVAEDGRRLGFLTFCLPVSVFCSVKSATLDIRGAERFLDGVADGFGDEGVGEVDRFGFQPDTRSRVEGRGSRARSTDVDVELVEEPRMLARKGRAKTSTGQRGWRPDDGGLDRGTRVIQRLRTRTLNIVTARTEFDHG